MKQNVLWRWGIIIAPILAAAYLMWPTYRYYQMDEERQALSSDSVQLAQWDELHGEDFQKVRQNRLKLGLDLRGGMYVTLEVDVLKLIEEAADETSVDGEFTSIIEKTRKETDNTDLDVLDTFLGLFKASGKSLLQYFTISSQLDPTEEAVEERLRRDADAAVDQALQVIKQRINQYELSETEIQKVGSRRIQIELPDVKDEQEIRSLLQTTARLEFKRVLMNRETIRTFYAIDRVLKGVSPDSTDVVSDSAIARADTASKDTAVADTSGSDTAKSDTTNPYTNLPKEEQERAIKRDYPFTHMIAGYFAANEKATMQPFDFVLKKPEDFPETGIYRFIIGEKFLSQLLRLLNRPEVQKVIPVDLQILIGANAEGRTASAEGTGVYDVYTVAREADLTGDVITEAFPTYDPSSGHPVVSMSMNPEGAERWAQITGANVGKRIAIVLDGRVYSAPNVINKIPNGSSQITGMGGVQEANLLAVVLKAGALKAPVKIIEERVVGPSLGEDSIRRGIMSSILSFALVVLFMLVYYMLGGGLADVALLMNVLLVVATLVGLQGTLTLPGIAGIILATAMAVDANILIFERMREELAAGRTLRTALEQGYAKAWSAILDSNLTNMLSGVVLIFLGSGPVKGFAWTLIIGVLMTLFTAVVVTRSMFELYLSTGATTINLGQKKTAQAVV
ncbi:MAG: protein translocase subunit SecD [Ignavibacteria bacterium]|nr:protein translocase subunit SecD [Ignavibacteria bacterium]